MLRKSMKAVKGAVVFYFAVQAVLTAWAYIIYPVLYQEWDYTGLALNGATFFAYLFGVISYSVAGRGRKVTGLRIAAFILCMLSAGYVWRADLEELFSYFSPTPRGIASLATTFFSYAALTALYVALYLLLPSLIARAALEASVPEGPFMRAAERQYASSPAYGGGYIGPIKCILLYCFTLGIWPLVWMYRTTKRLNAAPEGPTYSPGKQLLACLFIPTYIVFWFYKQGQKMDSILREKGLPAGIAVPCLLTSILPCVPVLVMQDKFNELDRADWQSRTAAPQRTVAAAPTAAPTPAAPTPAAPAYSAANAAAYPQREDNAVSPAYARQEDRSAAPAHAGQEDRAAAAAYGQREDHTISGATTVLSEDDAAQELIKYRQLFEMGVITWEEFESVRKKLAP